MPADAAVLGIDHVQITIPVGNEAKARNFYCGVLGLSEIPKPASLAARGGFWLQLGQIQLHIGTEPDRDRLRTKAHVAFRVTELPTWHVRLENVGCIVEESIPISGFDRFETRDPFGNRIEFIEST